MKKSVCKALGAGLIAGIGLLLLGTTPAGAGTGPQVMSSGEGSGLVTGNSVVAVASAPWTICSIDAAASILGGAFATSSCVPTGSQDSGPVVASSGMGEGAGSGNSVVGVASAPWTICGIGGAATIAGVAVADNVC